MRLFFRRIFGHLPAFKKDSRRHHTPHLSSEQVNNLVRKLDDLMEQQRPYLKESYNLKTMADELKIQQYQLSAFLNHELGVNFNDYLNERRIRHCEELIQNGVANRLNLKGLASKCGFHNRNTFTTAFKKFTGSTPSDYTRRHRA
jgi:AraC-like DNA-binding protein